MEHQEFVQVTQQSVGCLVRPSAPKRSYSISMSHPEILDWFGDREVFFMPPFSESPVERGVKNMMTYLDVLWHEDNFLFFRMHEKWRTHIYHKKRKNPSDTIQNETPPAPKSETTGRYLLDCMGSLYCDNDHVIVVRTHADVDGEEELVIEPSDTIPYEQFVEWTTDSVGPTKRFRQRQADNDRRCRQQTIDLM